MTRPSTFSGTASLFDDFFEDFPSTKLGNGFKNVPSANVIEHENEFIIELAAPGIKKGDFNIDMANGQLIISAEQKDEKEEENENFTRREFSYNSFSRAFTLPDSIDSDKINAQYKEGILKLNLPKKEESKKQAKKRIEIK
ncbi:Hsp20/alpha crystallin family protein [Marivirga sp. S37H4]|uniref:Hsp20/alpha crystallin family protein n=2 Tax=Marivirga aurantiaca TaxID=2802615 RepID=A0A935C6I2_9BACT|nr:Hsp20/alpha crystallin family protein [Marivirga aurantiaca]